MGWPIGCRVIASLLPPFGVLGGPWVSSQDTVGCTPHICKGNRVEVWEELEHMGYPQLLHLYLPEEILVGPGIASEEVEEIFVEA
jgi:hypothetical protein